MTVRLRVSFIGAALVAASCGSGDAGVPSTTVRDSAGVSIIENRGEPPADGGGFAIAAEPTLQIGASEGDDDYLLFRVWGAARLPDGRIAIANNRAPDIRVYSATGEHLHTFGRRGEGPEDFESPVLVGTLPGDTLVVVDRLLRRIDLYDPDTGFIRAGIADPSLEGYLLTVGMFANGSVMTQRWVYAEGMPDGYQRDPIQYRSIALDGSLERDFGELPGNETVRASQESQPGMVSVLTSGTPFGKSAVAVVVGDFFFYGSQDTWQIEVRDQDGRLVRIIRRDKALEPVTDEQVDALMEEGAENAATSEQARTFRRMLRDAPVPEFHPAYQAIYADAMGCLWVEETRVPGGDTTRHTTIFDPEGRMVGSVVLPDGFRVEQIGMDYVLGRWADDLGVEYVRLYPLTRPAAEAANGG
jgi:hypothetical protein